MTNPKPPGQIGANGHFGHWIREDPQQTALDGDYTFANAALGMFKGKSTPRASAAFLIFV